jgi:hypothetical protein
LKPSVFDCAAWDGHVIDLYGLPWLIGFEDDANPYGHAVTP